MSGALLGKPQFPQKRAIHSTKETRFTATASGSVGVLIDGVLTPLNVNQHITWESPFAFHSVIGSHSLAMPIVERPSDKVVADGYRRTVTCPAQFFPRDRPVLATDLECDLAHTRGRSTERRYILGRSHRRTRRCRRRAETHRNTHIHRDTQQRQRASYSRSATVDTRHTGKKRERIKKKSRTALIAQQSLEAHLSANRQTKLSSSELAVYCLQLKTLDHSNDLIKARRYEIVPSTAASYWSPGSPASSLPWWYHDTVDCARHSVSARCSDLRRSGDPPSKDVFWPGHSDKQHQASRKNTQPKYTDKDEDSHDGLVCKGGCSTVSSVRLCYLKLTNLALMACLFSCEAATSKTAFLRCRFAQRTSPNETDAVVKPEFARSYQMLLQTAGKRAR